MKYIDILCLKAGYVVMVSVLNALMLQKIKIKIINCILPI